LLVGPGGPARVGEEQQAQQAAGLSLLEESSTSRVSARCRARSQSSSRTSASPLGGRVADAEEQVDGGEHAVEALGQLRPKALRPAGSPMASDMPRGAGGTNAARILAGDTFRSAKYKSGPEPAPAKDKGKRS